jgi:hypothetical protein
MRVQDRSGPTSQTACLKGLRVGAGYRAGIAARA